MKRLFIVLLAGFATFHLTTTLHAQATITPAEPESAGFSTTGLTAVSRELQRRIDRGDIPGAVGAVLRDDRLIYSEAAGYRNLETGEPMTTDTLFRIYSMTRPVTALGILMLHDEGLLDINDPLIGYLPQFADQEVLRDPSNPNPRQTRPRQGDITLLQLLTHTSGLGSRNSTMYRENGVFRYDLTLEQVVDRAAALPLFEDPGTRYRYGLHAEVLGRVIEVVSGRPYAEFMEQRVFAPLGMRDTVFHVDEARADRLTPVYRPDESGELQRIEMETIPVTGDRALTSAGVGLVSTAEDMLRFGLLFLQEGRVNGEQLVSPEVIRLAGENAIPGELLPIDGYSSPYWTGSGWTAGGFAVALDPSAYAHTISPGEYWWDGSTGTRLWIDPVEGIVTVIMGQVSPASGNGFREAFKTGVYEAITESRSP